MPPGNTPITGTNSQFTAPQRSKLPDFLASQFQVPDVQIGTADLNAVDPQFRDIYRQFNQNIDALRGQREAALQSATASRDVLASQLNRGTQAAEQERIRNEGRTRQTAEELRRRNRERVRASGAGSSSAALELENRLNRETLQNIGNIGEQFSQRRASLEEQALQGITGIQNRLQDTISQILNNASMTLREKDAAIRSAQERKAMQDYYNSMFGGMGGGQQGQYADGFAGDVIPGEEVTPITGDYASTAARLRGELGALGGFAMSGIDAQEAANISDLARQYGVDRSGFDFNVKAPSRAYISRLPGSRDALQLMQTNPALAASLMAPKPGMAAPISPQVAAGAGAANLLNR
jgi:hypothetical protein